MRRRVALSIAAAIALQVCCLSASTRAATSNFPCDAFAKNPDGSWTVSAYAGEEAVSYLIGIGCSVAVAMNAEQVQTAIGRGQSQNPI